jgi:hypothetical protein
MADVLMIWALLFVVWSGALIGIVKGRGIALFTSIVALTGCILAVFWVASNTFGPIIWFILLLLIWAAIGAGWIVAAHRIP